MIQKYGIYDPLGVTLLNRLGLGFSHLREHKFRHNFADTLNPLCSSPLETEDTEHQFLIPIYMYVCIYICRYVHIHIYVYMYVCVYICI